MDILTDPTELMNRYAFLMIEWARAEKDFWLPNNSLKPTRLAAGKLIGVSAARVC